MSYPQRAKGWRTLTVDSQLFRWRFQIGAKTNTVTVQGAASSGSQVVVTLLDWLSPWDFVGHLHLIDNEPRIITAQFARRAISFALAQGWQPEKPGTPLQLHYRNFTFFSPELYLTDPSKVPAIPPRTAHYPPQYDFKAVRIDIDPKR